VATASVLTGQLGQILATSWQEYTERLRQSAPKVSNHRMRHHEGHYGTEFPLPNERQRRTPKSTSSVSTASGRSIGAHPEIQQIRQGPARLLSHARHGVQYHLAGQNEDRVDKPGSYAR
jgi:hypothetical protein